MLALVITVVTIKTAELSSVYNYNDLNPYITASVDGPQGPNVVFQYRQYYS